MLEVKRKSDDFIQTCRMLSEIYDNVPKHLDCVIQTIEFHIIDDKKRKAVLKWLNRGA